MPIFYMVDAIHSRASQAKWSDCSRLDVVWPQRSAGGTENMVIFWGLEVRGKVWQHESAAPVPQWAQRVVDVTCLSVSEEINQVPNKTALCLMLETSNYLGVGGLRVGCGSRWGGHFTSQASWQEEERIVTMGPNLTCGLEFLPNGSCFPEEFWMWEQLNFSPLLSHTTVSHLRMFHYLA